MRTVLYIGFAVILLVPALYIILHAIGSVIAGWSASKRTWPGAVVGALLGLAIAFLMRKAIYIIAGAAIIGGVLGWLLDRKVSTSAFWKKFLEKHFPEPEASDGNPIDPPYTGGGGGFGGYGGGSSGGGGASGKW